ncbi:peptidoglycan D,D-transpeptidase FtsI family protein [Lawsonella clevelandensis]|uniref:Penicillin-binding protein PbpB n=1 Tax=Lawsonella clevelandensis TaxID=1528099 RepID=A0A5E4A055_9ACTN|nr:penicillin-binding protein 2 [Lawsonella clevelandensis]VHO01629.1 Penicillin-binding protein PbpB [Lawsonella clevelandensis]
MQGGRPAPRRSSGPHYTQPGPVGRSPHHNYRTGPAAQKSLRGTFPILNQRLSSVSMGKRLRGGGIVLVVLLVFFFAQLTRVQVFERPRLLKEVQNQRTVTQILHSPRGEILDIHGTRLAYSRDARNLTFQPSIVRQQMQSAREADPSASSFTEYITGIANMLASEIPGVDAEDMMTRMSSNESFTYLAKNVDPVVATRVIDKYPQVGQEYQQIREYPGGSLGANVIGAVGVDNNGILGLESSENTLLAGRDGERTYDQATDGAFIPGSERNDIAPVSGSTITLTLDADVQYFVQAAVESAKINSGARNAGVVVLDAKTGHVVAMANDTTFNPGANLLRQADFDMGNPSITSPFEPGSVNKIVAASAAIQYNVAKPTEVFHVPGQIQMDSVTVRDAWVHGVVPYTMTGIFGKSSNVGTLMISQRVGKTRFAEMLRKFGLGHTTGIELAGESAGVVPALRQWQGGSFANLPIGQGLSITLLQMASIYQAIANDGLRIPPRIIASITKPNGQVVHQGSPAGIRVVSAETARTVRNMFRAVVQSDTGYQQGTGPQASVEGYQISGKTGTAQQVDPRCNCYSNSMYWITFAGIAPADNPRYVIAIMLDNPVRGVHGEGGQTAAPLFHDIAQWLLTRDNVPLSPPAPRLILQAG